MSQISRRRGIPLLDVGTIACIRRRLIAVLSRVALVHPELRPLLDSREEAFHAVVLAIGYRPALASFLDVADGIPRRCGRHPRRCGRHPSTERRRPLT